MKDNKNQEVKELECGFSVMNEMAEAFEQTDKERTPTLAEAVIRLESIIRRTGKNAMVLVDDLVAVTGRCRDDFNREDDHKYDNEDIILDLKCEPGAMTIVEAIKSLHANARYTTLDDYVN